VLVAEGAQSRDGEPITVERVKEVLGGAARARTLASTILGHVQRGGAPSAFDRCLATLLGQRGGRAACSPIRLTQHRN